MASMLTDAHVNSSLMFGLTTTLPAEFYINDIDVRMHQTHFILPLLIVRQKVTSSLPFEIFTNYRPWVLSTRR